MANRDMTSQIFSFDKMRKFVSVKVAVGGTGAVTLDAANSKGVASVTRNSAGNWTIQLGYSANGITFADQYNRLIGVRAIYDTSGVGSNTPRVALYGVDVVAETVKTDGKLTLLHTGPTAAGNTAAVAVDPASGEVVKLVFELADSDAP